MQTQKQKDFAAGLRTWERPRAGLSKCGASVFYEPCDAEGEGTLLRSGSRGQRQMKTRARGKRSCCCCVRCCFAAFDSLQTASNSTRSTRARSKLNEQDMTRQDLLECRRRGKAGGRGRGRGTCCCCCLCTLTGPVQPYEFVGQLPQTDNHYNQVNKMMIIVSSSASTAAAAQHVALFIFSDLFEDFLWVVRSTLFPPRVSAFSTRCTYAYVCFFYYLFIWALRV